MEVFDILVYPGDEPIENAKVEVVLVADENGRGTGWDPAANYAILGRWQPEVDETGRWELDLRPNANVEPDGTAYKITYTPPDTPRRSETPFFIEVPTTGTSHHVFGILTEAPTSLPTPALEQHETSIGNHDDVDNTGAGSGKALVHDGTKYVPVDVATQAELGTETTARTNADTALHTALDDEEAARIAADAALIPLAQKGTAEGVATLDGGGKIPSAQMPPLAIGETFPVASQAAMLVLTAERGDIALRTDLDPDGFFILTTDDPTVLANWVQITAPGAVISVNGQTGSVSLTATHIAFTPVGAIAATTVQAALGELDAETVKLAGVQTIEGIKTTLDDLKMAGGRPFCDVAALAEAEGITLAAAFALAQTFTKFIFVRGDAYLLGTGQGIELTEDDLLVLCEPSLDLVVDGLGVYCVRFGGDNQRWYFGRTYDPDPINHVGGPGPEESHGFCFRLSDGTVATRPKVIGVVCDNMGDESFDTLGCDDYEIDAHIFNGGAATAAGGAIGLNTSARGKVRAIIEGTKSGNSVKIETAGALVPKDVIGDLEIDIDIRDQVSTAPAFYIVPANDDVNGFIHGVVKVTDCAGEAFVCEPDPGGSTDRVSGPVKIDLFVRNGGDDVVIPGGSARAAARWTARTDKLDIWVDIYNWGPKDGAGVPNAEGAHGACGVGGRIRGIIDRVADCGVKDLSTTTSGPMTMDVETGNTGLGASGERKSISLSNATPPRFVKHKSRGGNRNEYAQTRMGVPRVGHPLHASTGGQFGAGVTRYGRVEDGGIVAKIRAQFTASGGNVCASVHANSGFGTAATPATRRATSGSIPCPAIGVGDITLDQTVAVHEGEDWFGLGGDSTTYAVLRTQATTGTSTLGAGFGKSETVFPAPATAAPSADSLIQPVLIGLAA